MRSLALCLFLVLSMICHRGLTASIQGKTEIASTTDHFASPQMEEYNVQEVLLRTKRHSHLSICRFCCNCCKSNSCGMCCVT